MCEDVTVFPRLLVLLELASGFWGIHGMMEFEYYDGSQDKLEVINPYKLGSTNLFAPLKVNQPFCPFFDNRSPQVQTDLQNCTWYRERSCCRQAELESIFRKVKPLQGASQECLRQINYMICWVCDPSQYNFYLNGWHQLTVCGSFCNSVLAACRTAKLKGDYVGELYPTGAEFCRSRRFKVASDNKDCFSYSGSRNQPRDPWARLVGSASFLHAQCLTNIVALFVMFYSSRVFILPR